MGIKTDLKDFYDKEAEKYYYTRNKYRSDGYIILNKIKKYNKTNISILEFGCGGGRLINFLNHEIKKKKLNIKINYIGVDLSQKLLDFAKKDNKEFNSKTKDKFICEDITTYTKKLKQESLDFIIGIASFQHIPNQQERLFVLKNFYKALKYDGKLIMINRSFSNWFIKKFKKVIFKSLIKTVYTLGNHDWRNLNIPRQKSKQNDNIENKNHYRFYHIFGIQELNLLGKLSGFKIDESTYIDRNGHKTKNRKKCKNTLFVGNKEIFYK